MNSPANPAVTENIGIKDIEQLRLLTIAQVDEIIENHGSPVYVYSEAKLREQARKLMAFPNAHGITVRYAMKASPNRNILRIFEQEGLHLDCSSGYEASRALDAGMPGHKIQLTGQQFPHNMTGLHAQGVMFNATSIQQIHDYGVLCPGSEISLRFNPGTGSGGTNRTNVGGPSSSFGIWHEYIQEAKRTCEKYGLKVTKLHTHIGSGSDPEVWAKVSKMSLELCHHFPDAHTLNLGGGFKVGRMQDESDADLDNIGHQVRENFEAFAQSTGRKLKLEIEPGTYLVANSASLVTQIHDIVDTGEAGYTFLKVDSGMTEVARPTLYGAQHPLVVVNQAKEVVRYIVSGHCCESGDILTPAPGDPEGLAPRPLAKAAIGDPLVIEGVGAYCAGMPIDNYNSFPTSAELLLREDGTIVTIRKPQEPKKVWENETSIIH